MQMLVATRYNSYVGVGKVRISPAGVASGYQISICKPTERSETQVTKLYAFRG